MNASSERCARALPRFSDDPITRVVQNLLLYWQFAYYKSTILKVFSQTIPETLRTADITSMSLERIFGSIDEKKKHIIPPAFTNDVHFVVISELTSLLGQREAMRQFSNVMNIVLEGEKVTRQILKLGYGEINKEELAHLEGKGVSYDPFEAKLSYTPNVCVLTATRPLDNRYFTYLNRSGHFSRYHVIQHHVTDEARAQYHKNVIEFHTGIDPAKANGLDLEDSINFLKHVWGSCLNWGNQSIDYIGRSVQELSGFLASFTFMEEIHDHHVFLERLEKYPSKKQISSVSEDQVVRLTELSPKFHSVRIKTAALIMRFLCLDCNFFEVDKSRLIPPLDRVNYRMCKQLFGEEYALDKFGKERASFGKKANSAFDSLGKDVLGENKILIDNLWFIGHFYHDRRKDVEPTCEMRKGAVIIDYPLLKDVIHKLPRSCPFLKYGCKRQVT